MAQPSEKEVPPPGSAAHRVTEEPGVPEVEVGAVDGGPAEDVAATGTALRPGERDSGLDLDDAPGATGPGAG